MASRSQLPTSRIRVQAAVNLLKQVLLDEAHIGGRVQWESFSVAMDRFAPSPTDTIDQDTWKNWMSGAVLPRTSKLALLDDVLWNALQTQVCREQTSIQSDPRRRLISRIANGESVQHELLPPVGNLVRHLDAIDAAAWGSGRNEDEWRNEKLRRANEVLARLHEAWNPNNGWIYKTFRSDLKIEYENADSLGREKIRATAARFTPPLFEYWMSKTPGPSPEYCRRYSVLVPFSVIPFLLDIALDKRFLIEERLSTWAVDLASAAAALQAIWYAHRNETVGSIQFIEESHWLNGFEELFWSRDFKFDTALWRFGFQGPLGGVGATEKFCYSKLLLARRAYHKFLRTYGISYQAIGESFEPQWHQWPVRVT